MRKLFLIFVISICLLTTISSMESLKPAKVNQPYTLIQTCEPACTYVNVTVSTINGFIIQNQPMAYNGTQWIYNITPTTLSRHDVTGFGDPGGINDSFSTYFDVTPSGLVLSTGDSLMYTLFSVILFGIILTLCFFIFTMPKGNEKDSRGFETGVLKIKYLRVVFIGITYGLVILLLNFLTGLAVNFAALSLFEGLLGAAFSILLSIAWPFTVILMFWIVVMLVHDTNVKRQIRKIQGIRF